MTLNHVDLTVVVPAKGLMQNWKNLEDLFLDGLSLNIEMILICDVFSNPLASQELKLVSKIRAYGGKVFEVSAGSPGVARNFGIQNASGNFLVFCDADDRLYFTNIIKAVEIMKAKNLDLLIGGIEIVYDRDPHRNTKFLCRKNLDIYQNLAILPGFSRIIYRKNIIPVPAFQPFLSGEDQAFLVDILKNGPSYSYSSDNLYLYRRGFEGQATSNKSTFSTSYISIKYITASYSRNSDLNFLIMVFSFRQYLSFAKRLIPETLGKFITLSFFLIIKTIRHPVTARRSIISILKNRGTV